jgi:hypothetical protein
MQLKAIAAVSIIALVAGAPRLQAADPPNFDFLGYCIVPTSQGGTLTARSVLTNGNTVPTPIALDFNNNQYTMVLTATLTVVGPPSQYSPATVQLYEDPISGGTNADYANPATFTDGTLILSGVIDGNLTRNRFTTTLGNYIGKIDFTGGTRLGDLQTTQDWPIGGGWSRNASVTPPIPPGYNEQWDGKIDNAPVAVEQRSWGAVKEFYRP